MDKTTVKAKGVAGSVVCAALLIAIPFIKGHEGNSLKAYRDTAGIYTICGGIAHVSPTMTATEAECKAMTESTIGKFMTQVAAIVPADTPAPTLAAYADFAYNVGIGAFSGSSVLRLANQGDLKGSCESLLKWRYVSGKDCSISSNNCFGIWTRRQEERALCLEGVKPE